MATEGFKRKTYKLKWPEGHDLHGLEVFTKGLPVRKAFELGSVGAAMGNDGDPEAKLAAYDQLCAEFARRLIRWNLQEDDGTPVPATLEGIEDQDMDVMLPLMMTWMDAVSSVDTPLSAASANGHSPAPEASLPMEPLSPSPQS